MKAHEMSELFALMMLAWPNAPMFQNGKMEPTIRLWTLCLSEMDFTTGQAAVIRLCRTSKFPPSIAEMREAGEKIRKRIKGEADSVILSLRNETPFHSEKIRLRAEQAIELMGGEERLLTPIDENCSRYNVEDFRDAYRQVWREETRRTVQALYSPDAAELPE